MLVRLGDNLGEAALPPYYPTRPSDVISYVEHLDETVEDALSDPLALEHALDALPPGPAPARAAVDVALHDRWARRLGQPLYRLFGLSRGDAPLSTYTLSIPESEADLQATLRALPPYPVLKLKLGSGDAEQDVAFARIVREQSSATLYVDANGAWDVETAAHAIPRLGALGVGLVEEPLPKGDPAAWHRLHALLPPTTPSLFADESVQSASDILALAGAIDGVNVKVAKAGGLRGARRWITLARALGLRVLFGCMVESSLGVTAAAHLAPLADGCDLDGLLYLADDPFEGLAWDLGRLILPDRPGLGVVAR